MADDEREAQMRRLRQEGKAPQQEWIDRSVTFEWSEIEIDFLLHRLDEARAQIGRLKRDLTQAVVQIWGFYEGERPVYCQGDKAAERALEVAQAALMWGIESTAGTAQP